MINKSISDPKKEIWVNLELYFKSYEFSNFYEYFENFLFYLKLFFILK